MLISQAEWARRHGFSRQYVHKLVRKGIIALVDGKIDPPQADAAIEAIRQPALPPRRGQDAGNSGAQAEVDKGTGSVDRSEVDTRAVSGRTPDPPLAGTGKPNLPEMLLRARTKSEMAPPDQTSRACSRSRPAPVPRRWSIPTR